MSMMQKVRYKQNFHLRKLDESYNMEDLKYQAKEFGFYFATTGIVY